MDRSQLLMESVNTHLEHIEELIFNEGVDGTRRAIMFLKDIRDTLAGHTSGRVNAITVKWDGAPAIFAGIDPSDNRFFVSKKGIFNKTPVVYKTHDDIKRELKGDLQKKFSIALDEFSKLGIRKGIYQGDLMFTKSDLKTQNINGEKHVTFHPNTIVYAVPVDSKLGKRIMRARIGVVWHTTYSGKDIKSLKASFGGDIVRNLKDVKTVWQDDATFKDATGVATFSEEETKELTSLLSQAGKSFNKVSKELLDGIADNPQVSTRIKAYNNARVRSGEPCPSPRTHVKGLRSHIEEWIEKQVESKKTEATKEKWKEKGQEIMRTIFSRSNELISLFELMNVLIQAKMMVVNKLNEASDSKTFVRTRNGLRPTTPEGYVAIDKIGNAVKLVDRLEFSRANFSPDVLKGWE